MSRRRINRRGRRPNPRTEDGRMIRPPANDETVIPKEAIAQRARIVGEANALDHKSGTALGQLLHGGYIDARQHDAGLRVQRVWSTWMRLAGCPPLALVAHVQGQSVSDDDARAAEEWNRAKDDFDAMARVIRSQEASKLVWDAVEMVCLGAVDFRENPVMLERWPMWGSRFRGALDDLARLWKISAKEST